MKAIILLCLVPAIAGAQVYKCETPSGVVFTDRECDGEIVALADESAGLGGQVPDAVLADLERKRADRSRRRFAGRLYDWRDDEVAAIDRQISNLERDKARANNNLAGATYAAGLDAQIAALQSARRETINSTQDQVVRVIRDSDR